jgi:hypothetical protein
MVVSTRSSFPVGLVVLLSAVALSLQPRTFAAEQKDQKDDKAKRATLVVKVAPAVSFSPARVTATAELRGGTDGDGELYCPALEWDWGDGTRSEANEDCEPFEAGKSSIKRRWTSTHTFTVSGTYRVQLRLKRGTRSIIAGNTNVQVKPGVRDFGDYPQP